MSSQSHREMSGITENISRVDDIELTERFSEDMAKLFLNDDYADVTFLVESTRLPAHRVILAARSEYFRALLFGGLSETTQNEITLKVPLAAFKCLLKYIYSGHMPLAQMSEETILDTLGLSNQYGFPELEASISEYLRNNLSLNNACSVLDASRLYNLDKLATVCLIFMDRNAVELLEHETFINLGKQCLEELLARDSFFAPEVRIFLSVAEWCKHNPTENGESVVSLVRLPLMTLEHLLHVVRPTGIISPDVLLDAIEEQVTSQNLPFRAALWPEENVASAKFVSRTIQGELRSALLNGDTVNYDSENGYTRHYITDSNDSGIIVELGTMCIINHIKLLLWDRDNRSYSYFIEVSVNRNQWERVVDYSQYRCRSWQTLYFAPRAVRFIHLVGTHNTVNKVFHVVAMEALYTINMPKLINDVIVPTANVATIEMSAIVLDGVSRTRNALLNGDFVSYDWDSGYTCHQLGSGEILVRLSQPYHIGTMRLLLWDCDDRNYSFYIESSVDQHDWQIIVDKRKEFTRSWQNFSFTPRPIIFIRIVGTRNTANEVFHCVHLECPSQDQGFLAKVKLNKETISEPIAAEASSIPPQIAAEVDNNETVDLAVQPLQNENCEDIQ